MKNKVGYIVLLICLGSYIFGSVYGRGVDLCACKSPYPRIILSQPTTSIVGGSSVTLKWSYEYNLSVVSSLDCLLINFSIVLPSGELASVLYNKSFSQLPTEYTYTIPSAMQVNGTTMTFKIQFYFFVLVGSVLQIYTYAKQITLTWSTSGEITSPSFDASLWIWIIVAVVGVGIVIAIYYYYRKKQQQEEMGIMAYTPYSPSPIYQPPPYYPSPAPQYQMTVQPQYQPPPQPQPQPQFIQPQPIPQPIPQTQPEPEPVIEATISQECLSNEDRLFNDPVCIEQFRKVKGKTPSEFFNRPKKAKLI